jgi:hypothetical protein
MTVNTTAH